MCTVTRSAGRRILVAGRGGLTVNTFGEQGGHILMTNSAVDFGQLFRMWFSAGVRMAAHTVKRTMYGCLKRGIINKE